MRNLKKTRSFASFASFFPFLGRWADERFKQGRSVNSSCLVLTLLGQKGVVS